MVTGFIVVHPGGRRVNSGFAGFIGVHPVGRRSLPGMLGSLEYALGDVGFIRCHWVLCGAPLGSSFFFQSHWIHSGTPWRLSGSSMVAGLIEVHPGCRGIHLGLLGSLECVVGSSSSFRVPGFIVVPPGSRQDHSGSLGSLGCTLGVVGFIRDRWTAPCRSSGSFAVIRFIRGRWVH